MTMRIFDKTNDKWLDFPPFEVIVDERFLIVTSSDYPDCDGNMIYDGDVIACEYTGDDGNVAYNYSQVFFKDGCFFVDTGAVQETTEEHRIPLYQFASDSIRIVGTIFTNFKGLRYSDPNDDSQFITKALLRNGLPQNR